MKKIVIGILAHVDSGKTTLTESMLLKSGDIRKAGRVDHRDTFLDTNEIERERGITIFSKQAVMHTPLCEITILDTPGHVDFSAEAERVLSVLDYAILVISASEGVQSHTETLWRLLAKYDVPTFVVVNKMDLALSQKAEIIGNIKAELSDNIVDFSDENFSEEILDELSVCTEGLMNEYLSENKVSEKEIQRAVSSRQLFPCFFGSALKHEGTDKIISGLLKYTEEKVYPKEFGARVFKISDDGKGTRLTHLKITGGTLKVKDEVKGKSDWSEKINQIRIYSGEKYETPEELEAGAVCAVTGLSKTFSGEGLGIEINLESPVLEPVLSYKVVLPESVNIRDALIKLKRLEEEEPQLKIAWKEELSEIHIMLMGEVQLEIVKRLIKSKFDIDAEFGEGTISYKETVADKVLGIGHFEPLRHYAEVHLLVEPLKAGSGIKFESALSFDELDRSWQRLIMTHLSEKTHIGVLTGSPITDVKITLTGGRAHKKHTEGGDFRQATYRAVRNALMKAKSVLLEPRYDFKMTVPNENVGRALNDLSMMGARFSSSHLSGEMSVISGNASVSKMRGYQKELISYTSGRGRLFCVSSGYEPADDADEIIQRIGYNPERDTENSPDSVFCSHGAGFTVKWDEVENYADVEITFETEEELAKRVTENAKRLSERPKIEASDKELMAIFERTYGEIKAPKIEGARIVKAKEEIPERYIKPKKIKKYDKDYLLVDGYNIIHAWEDLKKLTLDSLDVARDKLIDILCNYSGYTGCETIVVFDAYKVKGSRGEVEKINNINVVYTKEAETADMYIEKVSRKLSVNNRVRVATSDGLEQLIILGAGALRVSAESFKKEVDDAILKIREMID